MVNGSIENNESPSQAMRKDETKHGGLENEYGHSLRFCT